MTATKQEGHFKTHRHTLKTTYFLNSGCPVLTISKLPFHILSHIPIPLLFILNEHEVIPSLADMRWFYVHIYCSRQSNYENALRIPTVVRITGQSHLPLRLPSRSEVPLLRSASHLTAQMIYEKVCGKHDEELINNLSITYSPTTRLCFSNSILSPRTCASISISCLLQIPNQNSKETSLIK